MQKTLIIIAVLALAIFTGWKLLPNSSENGDMQALVSTPPKMPFTSSQRKCFTAQKTIILHQTRLKGAVNRVLSNLKNSKITEKELNDPSAVARLVPKTHIRDMDFVTKDLDLALKSLPTACSVRSVYVRPLKG